MRPKEQKPDPALIAMQKADVVIRDRKLMAVGKKNEQQPAIRSRQQREHHSRTSPADSPWRGFPSMDVRESRNPRASPSGHLEHGESVCQAAARETLEETGIMLGPATLRHVLSIHQRNRGTSDTRVGFAFTPSAWTGEPVNTEPRCGMLRIERTGGRGAGVSSGAAVRAEVLDGLVVQAYDQYVMERLALPHGDLSDFALVNLFRGRLGEPMSADAATELFERLGDRAGLPRPVTAHMLRRGFASNLQPRRPPACRAENTRPRLASDDRALRQSGCPTRPSVTTGREPARSTPRASPSRSAPASRSSAPPGPSTTCHEPPRRSLTATASCRS